MVIVIPGHGPTNVVAGNWYHELRSKFTAVGVAVAIWDRPGCGKSEGEYDHNQSVYSSADEAVAAIHSIRSNRVPDYERIGMWGGSRGGWIAPLAMDKDPDIGFWISVSGPDAFETWGYLFRSTLELEGYSKQEAEFFYHQWIKANLIFSQGVGYEEYQRETDALRRNQIYQKLSGQPYLSPEKGQGSRSGHSQWMSRKPVLGAATITNFGWSGESPTTFQPARVKSPRQRNRANAFTGRRGLNPSCSSQQIAM